MILFVDLEAYGPTLSPALARMWAEHTLMAKYRIEEIAGCPVLVIRHDRFTPDMPARFGARAVIFGGHLTEVPAYSPGSRDGALAYARDPDRPLLGICGVHQLIAEAHGGRTGPLAPGTVPATDLPCLAASDLRQIRVDTAFARVGYLPARRSAAHPLVDSLPEEARFLHMHYWHVAELPAGFHVLARSADGVVQAMAHDTRPIFGTQFHPEGYGAEAPEGAELLRAFLLGDWGTVESEASVQARHATLHDPLMHAPEHRAPLHEPAAKG
jgi:GMP synthase-like glutamine amidotransferase